MKKNRLLISLVLFVFNINLYSQEHLTIQTNIKQIDFYNLKQYQVYKDFSDTINSNIDLRVFLFKKNKLKSINSTNKSNLSLLPKGDWVKFLDRCKRAKQFDMVVYNNKGKEIYSFIYSNGRLSFVEPDLFPLSLQGKGTNW